MLQPRVSTNWFKNSVVGGGPHGKLDISDGPATKHGQQFSGGREAHTSVENYGHSHQQATKQSELSIGGSSHFKGNFSTGLNSILRRRQLALNRSQKYRDRQALLNEQYRPGQPPTIQDIASKNKRIKNRPQRLE